MVSWSMLDLWCKSVTETGHLIYRFSIIHLSRIQIRFIQYWRNINFSDDSIDKKIFFNHFFFQMLLCNTCVLHKQFLFRTEERHFRDKLTPDFRYI